MRVFLSFNSKDVALAEGLRTSLSALDPHVSIFFSPVSMGAGFWLPRLAEEIAAADAFLLLIGPKGIGPWQEVEYFTAFDRHVKDKRFALVPVIAAGAEAPGLSFLRSLNWIEAAALSDNKVLHRLAAALRGENVASTRPLWQMVNPYRGLEAMTEANADYFYGREAETAAVLRTLAEKPGRCPMLIGASGAGKSSVAQAGVLAALKSMRWPAAEAGTSGWPKPLHNSRSWLWLTMRPAEAPLEAIAAAFTRLWQLDAKDPDHAALPRKWAKGLLAGDNTLADLIDATQDQLKERQGDAPERILLYLDQGEELYTRVAQDEARRFSELLAKGLQDRRLLVFGSLRADYFDRLQADEPLFSCHEHVNVPPLGRTALYNVVTGPARALEVAFEDDVAAGRITDAAATQPGALPLLSYLLTDMWSGMAKRADATLRLPAHAIDVGGVLARRAEEFLSQTPDEERELRRLLTLKLALVPPDGEPVRRQSHREECTEEEWALASRLADHPWRLVVMGEREADGRITAEVAHEELLRAWPRLADWLRDERDFLVFKGDAERAERRWREEMGKAEKALLTGLDLARAEEFIAGRSQDLSAAVVAFVQQSIAADRAARERQLRFQRRVSFAAGIAALVMAGVGAFAWNQWQRAATAEDSANTSLARSRENESRSLAALSRVATNDGAASGGVALALAAWPRDDADPRPRLPEAIRSLGNALWNLHPVVGEYRHGGPVMSAVFNRDETRVLSTSHDKTARMWDVATGRQVGPALHHDDIVRGAVFSKDESHILTWSSDKTVRLWDAKTGGQIGPAMTHESWISSARFNRDETRVIAWSSNSVRLWDAATGQQIGPGVTYKNIYEVTLSRDETRVLIRPDGNAVMLHQLATGRQIGLAMTHDERINGARFNRSDTTVLTWSNDKTIRRWDMKGREIGPRFAHDAAVNGAIFNRDETRILSWSADHALRLWDVDTGKQIGAEMKHAGTIRGAEFNRDETRILSWSTDGTVRIWDLEGKEVGPTSISHNTGIRSGARFTHDETRILSWSDDQTIRMWDVVSGRQIGPAIRHEREIWGVRMNRDETRILSWSYGVIELRDIAAGQEIGPAMSHDASVGDAALSADESRILSRSFDTVTVWDAATSRQIGVPMTHKGAVNGAVFIAGDTRILSWSDDRTLRIWNAATGEQIGPSMIHDDDVRGAISYRNDTRIVSWSVDRTLRLWNAATGQQIGPLITHEDPVSKVLLDRKERFILSLTERGLLRLWDAETGRQLGPALAHDHDGLWSALLTPDGARIVSWSSNHKILYMWEVATGRQIGPTMAHDESINGALLTRDGTRIVSWSDDKTVRFWDVATGQQVGPALVHDGGIIDVRLNHDESKLLSRYWRVFLSQNLRLWDVATGRQIGKTIEPSGSGVDALLTQDATRILSWSLDKSVRLWDVATGYQIGPSMWHDNSVFGALLTRDQTRVLSWSSDKTMQFWNIAWRGRNLFEIACNHSPPDHDLSEVSRRYGVRITDPICEPDKVIPLP